LQNLLASAYIQKVRESTDFTYLDRASKIVDGVLSADAGNYEAMRLRSEIEMERHHFAQVREYSEALTKIASDDTWNWGTLGDSLMELGEYDQAGKAYQKMVALNSNQASYNRLGLPPLCHRERQRGHRSDDPGSRIRELGARKYSLVPGGAR